MIPTINLAPAVPLASPNPKFELKKFWLSFANGPIPEEVVIGVPKGEVPVAVIVGFKGLRVVGVEKPGVENGELDVKPKGLGLDVVVVVGFEKGEVVPKGEEGFAVVAVVGFV